jgi:hypothetical protein
MNTARPKSEDPVELVAEPSRWVSTNGYRWVRGESGISEPKHGLFLVENPGESRPIVRANELYLELAQLDVSEESTLAFAARFGVLGLSRQHFHSMECSNIFGESSGDWGFEITEFQSCFKAWQAAEDRDLKALKEMLTVDSPTAADDKLWMQVKKDLPKAARSRVMDTINRYLAPRTTLTSPPKGCFKESCNKSALPSRAPRYVAYQLRPVEKSGKGKGKIEGHLSSSCLLVTAWLQFADMVSGQRRIRPCEICSRWMDVSEQARPRSKRMHDNCSLAERMRRYRSKLHSTDSSTEDVK